MSDGAYSVPMRTDVIIATVELDGGDGLIVTFSDGTITGYVAEELLQLRPKREPVASKDKLQRNRRLHPAWARSKDPGDLLSQRRNV